jgi:hypothetical protein
LSIGFRNSVSFLSAIQATGFLTLTPMGLSPTEHASLRWTHLRTRLVQSRAAVLCASVVIIEGFPASSSTLLAFGSSQGRLGGTTSRRPGSGSVNPEPYAEVRIGYAGRRVHGGPEAKQIGANCCRLFKPQGGETGAAMAYWADLGESRSASAAFTRFTGTPTPKTAEIAVQVVPYLAADAALN